MERYFVGIDNGGTNIKAAVFSSSGQQMSAASEQTPVTVVREGYHERDMIFLWEKTTAAIQKAISASGVAPEKIAAVGCTGHGKGLYLWGKDGKPCAPAIASTDQRAAELVKEWEQNGTTAQAGLLNLQSTLAYQPTALLAWLKRNQPEVYQNIQWVFEAKDYIRFMLTGRPFAEYTDSSGTGLLNLRKKAYDPELLRLYGIPEIAECLPPLADSAAHCGCVTKEAAACTGLPEGIPVCGGMFDIDACAIAMDVSDSVPICVITGTWSINEYISQEPVAPEEGVNHSLFCMPGYYLIEESSPTSAGNLDWARGILFRKEKPSYGEIDSMVASVAPESSSLLFFPFLYGSNARNRKHAAWVGLHSGHGTEHLLRAVYEGVAFSHKQHVERLLKHRQTPPYIRIAGGAANSDVWMQLFADVLETPLQVVDGKELGAMGAAIAASICCGAYPDYHTAAKEMVHIRKTFSPDARMVPVYREKYALYQEMLER